MAKTKKFRWRWDLGLALASSVAAAFFADAQSLTAASGEIVTFFGIQAAAIFPAMLLTATILRPEGLSPRDVKRYRGALHGQMVFWSTLLGLDFAAVGLVIAGKATNWHFPLLYVPFHGWTHISAVVIGVSFFIGVLALARTVHAIIGIFSLMKVNLDLVEKTVGERVKHESEERKLETTPFVAPEGYGRVIDPPNLQ